MSPLQSNKDKRNFLKHYLKNPAREFYERIPLSERKEWGKLKNYLRAFFLSPQQAFCAKYELQKMTQLEKESIAEFVARLSTKAKQAFPNDPHLTTQAAKEEIKQALAYHSAPYLRRKMAKLLATGATLDKMIEKSREEEIFHLLDSGEQKEATNQDVIADPIKLVKFLSDHDFEIRKRESTPKVSFKEEQSVEVHQIDDTPKRNEEFRRSRTHPRSSEGYRIRSNSPSRNRSDSYDRGNRYRESKYNRISERKNWEEKSRDKENNSKERLSENITRDDLEKLKEEIILSNNNQSKGQFYNRRFRNGTRIRGGYRKFLPQRQSGLFSTE